MKKYEQLIYENHQKANKLKCNREYIFILILVSSIFVIETIILCILNFTANDIRQMNKRKQFEKEAIRFKNQLLDKTTALISSQIKSEEEHKQINLENKNAHSNWLIELRKINNKLLNLLNFHKMNKLGSTIIKSLDDYITLKEWSNCLISQLCYKSSINGLSAQVFHLNCDNFKPTLTLIEAENESLLGGFTNVSWDGDELKYDNTSFLFSLKFHKKYPNKKDMPGINASPKLLPSFGLKDILITDEEASLQNVLKCFQTNKVGYQNHDVNNKKIMFNVKEIEVFVMKCII